MNIFSIHEQILDQYSSYFASFLNIADPRIQSFIEHELFTEHKLWPGALLQLNPAYEKVATVEALAHSQVLHAECANIFRNRHGHSFHLYRHQQAALERAQRREPYVVTSGTGSGKSLTYFLPIFDAILKGDPAPARVWAIVVYPMNALVNSQEDALNELAEGYRQRTGHDMPVRFAKYTGQESATKKRELQENPPHILLTNYVMLEMMLVRPREADFVSPDRSSLQFIVMDELHTYRGRQGADVALLLRRLRERNGNRSILHIGTSATMASAGAQTARRKVVADFASRFFGTTVHPDNVIEEWLERILPEAQMPDEQTLRQAIVASPPTATWSDFAANPLSVWIEHTYGITTADDGRLIRPKPMTLQAGAAQLADLTGLDQGQCLVRLRTMLLLGSQVSHGDSSAFAFKLHQFISQGDSIYSTFEPPATRLLTLDGQFYAPGSKERLLFPLVFCRVCGQEYYRVKYHSETQRIIPDTGDVLAYEEELDADTIADGYLMLDVEGRWRNDTNDLPEHWFTRSGGIQKEYAHYRPRPLQITPNGSVTQEASDAHPGWFQPAPFMLCLCCGEAYTRRDTNDFRKLARLSSEGRSTATTLLSVASVGAMRNAEVDLTAQKILSFTDNRQDASLQAGHFNDFIQVARLRSALHRAVANAGELRFDTIAAQVVRALDVTLNDYARGSDDSTPLDPGSQQGQRAAATLRDQVEYRLYEDLRRGWRVVQPNLEQAGLLRIEYAGLQSLIDRSEPWATTPFMAEFEATERREVLITILDEMRRQSTIDVPILKDKKEQDQLKKRVLDYINEQWAFDEDERLRYASMFILPGDARAPGDFSLSERSVIGRWLLRLIQRRFGQRLDQQQFDAFIRALTAVLCQHGLLIMQTEGSGNWHRTGLRLRPSAMLWQPGDGTPAANPLRRYRAGSDTYAEQTVEANAFFQQFYPQAIDILKDMEGGAHTAQVSADMRQQRETRFKSGDLEALFCSPTMELGVDIRDLNAVHLRNVPPTPANYAQRSGRAGRAGQPALILTYASSGSGHDQYYFRHREAMVAGIVAPPTLELANEDLLRAHIHAIWLAKTGLNLAGINGTILEVIDTEDEALPLHSTVSDQVQLFPDQLRACIEESRRVLAACNIDGNSAEWLHETWVAEVVEQAANTFDQAFDRWRELFRLADEQLFNAQQLQRRRYRRRNADEDDSNIDDQIREAERQLDLLTCRNTRFEESDFYPYRYLASEGFLPGYNFPSLPVRAYIRRNSQGEFIARPRFLALSEFGPENTIYHEGAKYQVTQAWLPLQDPAQRFIRAKICLRCGYLHEGETAIPDNCCRNCNAALEGDNLDFISNLLEMPTVNTRRRMRITCDEEERLRQGYEVTTHFRYAQRENGQLSWRPAAVVPAQGATDSQSAALLQLNYAPSATLWRINHRWKRREERGYRLNLTTGQWLGANQEVDDAQADIRTQVHLFVRLTANALLLYPRGQGERVSEAFLATLQYALGRGIQALFQVEGNELTSERIGEGDQRGILFWEATEGGLGVLRRLVDEPQALAAVAAKALEVLHFTVEGIDERPPHDEQHGCARACYECLLSYYNQRDHAIIDRHVVVDYLQALAAGATQEGSGARDYASHYQWLRTQTDARSALERQLLDQLYQSGRKLPDAAQYQVPNAYAVPDFFYAPRTCIYCDGTVHDEPQQAANDEQHRRELRARGYHVIVIRHDQDLESQIQQHNYLFG